MNAALEVAGLPVLLFLDDDVMPSPGLVASHSQCYDDELVWAVVGQVLQPGEEPVDVPCRSESKGLRTDLEFPFCSTRRCDVANVMAGNLSVRRDRACQIGGFDENFVRVAYRFETDFARRLRQAGGRILFEPEASIRHLRASIGGTRVYSDHRRSHRPDHAVGDYYYAMRHGGTWERWSYSAYRMIRSVMTRYHLRRPWWIVPKLIGEVRGLAWALRLSASGPKLRLDADAGIRHPDAHRGDRDWSQGR